MNGLGEGRGRDEGLLRAAGHRDLADGVVSRNGIRHGLGRAVLVPRGPRLSVGVAEPPKNSIIEAPQNNIAE